MCYYERYDFSCGDHKWGNMKMQCELQWHIGETCGLAPKPLDGFIFQLQEQCRYCKEMQPKKRRIKKAESDIKRWQQDDAQKWRANIEKAQDDLTSLSGQLIKLNNKRTSVARKLWEDECMTSGEGGVCAWKLWRLDYSPWSFCSLACRVLCQCNHRFYLAIHLKREWFSSYVTSRGAKDVSWMSI